MDTKTAWCIRCGAEAEPGAACCPRCGDPVVAAGPNTPAASGEFSWEVNVPLLTNRFILYDLLKVWGISSLALFLLLGGILAYDRNWRAFSGMLPLLGLISVGFLVLLILVVLVFFGNRFPMGFRLDSQGAMVASLSRRGLWGNRLAVVLGALAGKPGVAGAGLLAMAQETTGIAWGEVRRLKVHPQTRVISLMDSWHVVIRLYCTPQNFEAVRSAVEKWAVRGLTKVTQTQRSKGVSPALRLWFKSLLAAVAAFLLTALPFETPAWLIWALLGVTLGAIWFPALARFCGIVSLMLAGAIVFGFVFQAVEMRQTTTEEDFRKFAQSQGISVDKVPDLALGKYRRYEHMDAQDWLQTGIAGLGLAFFVGVGLGAVRPRRRPETEGRGTP